MIKGIQLLLFTLFITTTLTNAQVLDRLSKQQQSIVQIAALTGKGSLPNLAIQLHAGLDAGLTINQIKEVIIHTYAYAGFPRSIRGLQTFMTVLDDREARGIKDKLGAEASPICYDASKYDRGKAVLDSLLGATQNGPQTGYSAFAPTIEIFLKEHLFADIFERDVLTYAERELVTIAVLSSIGGVEPMLRSHFGICLNVGLSGKQLKQFITVIESTVGKKESEDAKIVLDEVLKSRQKK
ncbi:MULTISPECIES: carboxymuconolactone decarboxylase family protein [Sphingobacterium]|uniref:carboxymuconolactone decarboxylase family protein n=1 Tax=Sphingobacterium TaxID=28453 RepID=UPI0013DB9996|nr:MULTISPECIES: carboxymuconolactone decarboxylase family protein [unclassified Sphingobacterium]